jgi:hypothetical protein
MRSQERGTLVSEPLILKHTLIKVIGEFPTCWVNRTQSKTPKSLGLQDCPGRWNFVEMMLCDTKMTVLESLTYVCMYRGRNTKGR